MKQNSLLNLLRKIHEDEDGAISLETVLIIGAIALPILIFLLKVGWPTVKQVLQPGHGRPRTTAATPRRSDRRRAPCWPPSLLLAFTLAAAVTDLLWNKIYNWNTYGGIADGVGLCQRAGTAASRRDDAMAVAGGDLLACGGLMVVCFVVFPGIGGGDVKLMAMLGAWLGWEKGIEALLWTFVLAACFALIGLIWKIGPLTAASAARCG